MKLLLAVALTCAVLTKSVAALGCVEGIPLKTVATHADIILLGRVEAVGNAIPPDPNAPYEGAIRVPQPYVATIRVQELWKGSTGPTIQLLQDSVLGGMGLARHVGATYLFFVRRLSPAAPLSSDHPITSGYSALECVSKQTGSTEEVTREFGKSYPPTK